MRCKYKQLEPVSVSVAAEPQQHDTAEPQQHDTAKPQQHDTVQPFRHLVIQLKGNGAGFL